MDHNPLNLRPLLYFVTAADAGSMTAAAKELYVSQSAVSLAIAGLERRLGVQLLLRHRSKGLTLTVTGAAIVGDARALLAHADELSTAARNLGETLTGRMVVGCYVTFAPFLLPRLIEGFQELHPGVRVDVIEGSVLDIQQLVRTGVCELALMYGLDLPPDLTPELLYMAWTSVVLHPTHRLASEDAITLSDLSGEPLVLLDTPPMPEYYKSILVNAGVDFSVRFRATSFEMARALVARGFGYSLLIQRPAIDLTYEGLRVITRPVRDPLPGLPIVIVTPKGAVPTRRAKAFAQFCRDSLPFDLRHLSPDPRVPMKG